MSQSREIDYRPEALVNLEALPDVQPTSGTDLHLLFIHILRSPIVLREALRLLQPSYFFPNELLWSCLWFAVQQLQTKYGSITFESLKHFMLQQTREDMRLSPEEVEELFQKEQPGGAAVDGTGQGFVHYAMNCPEQDLLPNYAFDILQKFLLERKVIHNMQQLNKANPSGAYMAGLPEVYKAALKEIQTISSLGAVPFVEAMPAWGTPLPVMEFWPTGMSFIDNYIVGQRPGDGIGILGAQGAGKTTLAVQLAIANAKQFYAEAMLTGKKPKLSLLATYEEPAEKLQRRIWAHAAQIPYYKMRATFDWNELSTPSNLNEHDYFIAGEAGRQGGVVLSEQDRWLASKVFLDTCMGILDMSSSAKSPGVGAGGVGELGSCCARLCDERKQEMGALGVDYVGIMCKNYMLANNISMDAMRHHIGGAGNQIRTQILEPHHAVGWLFHQLNGEQNKRSSSLLQNHWDAAEAKNFSENMAVCGCLGTVDKATGCLLLNWSKVRYEGQLGKSPPVLKLNGAYCRMDDVSNSYTMDSTTRTFLKAGVAREVQGLDASSVKTKPRSRNDGRGDDMDTGV